MQGNPLPLPSPDIRAPVPSRPVLEVADLTVTIATPSGELHAVRGINLIVRAGETLCIVGESGSGKSMTALAVMDLLPRQATRAVKRLAFQETDLTALPRRALDKLRGERLAMIFQDPSSALNPVKTIGSQLTGVYRRHRGGGRAEARARAVELLRRAGVPAPEVRLQQYPHQLSGGLKQRVMIAMSLMCGPSLLLADEPTTALDVTVQAQILRLLNELQREFSLGVMLITHDLGVAAAVSHTIAVMYAGEIVEQGPSEAIFRNPQHPYTRSLFDCLPTGRREHGSRLSAIPGIVPSLLSPPPGCAFAARCPLAEDICRKAPIPERSAGPEHVARCLKMPALDAERAALCQLH